MHSMQEMKDNQSVDMVITILCVVVDQERIYVEDVAGECELLKSHLVVETSRC